MFSKTLRSLLLALCLLTQQADASGLRRLRKSAVFVPELAPIEQNEKVDRDAGFETVEDELEDIFFNEVFRRLDASMSYDMSYQGGWFSYGGDGESHATSGHSGGDDADYVFDRQTGGDDAGNMNAAVSDDSEVYRKCGMTMESRSEMLLEILSTVSGRPELEDMSTAQYNARYWLDKEDEGMICPTSSERVLQRYRAALIYFEFNGDNWDNCRARGGPCFQEDSTSVPAIRFLDASNECLWFGLTCTNVPREVQPSQSWMLTVDDFEPIISVDISDNSLRGTLFDELFGLTSLQELTLDGNKGITGQIPEAIGQLTSLIALDIDDNELTGSLPDALFGLTNLEAIDLNSNSLTGTIPNQIGNLKNLVVVQLDNNNLSGAMPTDGLLMLESLAVWTVLDNDLTGSVEPVCDVLDQRRAANQFPGYLQFFWVDCLGNPPQVECSCCECEEPQNPTSF